MKASWVPAVLLLLSGCKIVSAGTRHTNAENGVWYVKKPVLGDARIYYCPPGEPKCYRAKIREGAQEPSKWQLEGISKRTGGLERQVSVARRDG